MAEQGVNGVGGRLQAVLPSMQKGPVSCPRFTGSQASCLSRKAEVGAHHGLAEHAMCWGRGVGAEVLQHA
jgi:hypothetical protein